MNEKKVLFSQGYMIPNYGFRLETVSYHFITDGIRNLIESKYLHKLKGWNLYFTIVFADDRTIPMETAIVMGPSRNTYDKIMDYGVHLPSSQIIQSTYPFKEFSHYFFDAITEFLHTKFDIDKDELKAIEKQVTEGFSPINGKVLCNSVF
jgi:hypothetical protein